MDSPEQLYVTDEHKDYTVSGYYMYCPSATICKDVATDFSMTKIQFGHDPKQTTSSVKVRSTFRCFVPRRPFASLLSSSW